MRAGRSDCSAHIFWHRRVVAKEAYQLGVMDVISKPVIPYVVERQQSALLRQAEQIIEFNRGMIESLSTAIEFRNGESGEHVRRIHDITRYMLEHTSLSAGMSPEDIDAIALAAIMHDVGKIAIPDAILNKPGRLTPEERSLRS